jgi:alginate O-acetyltransferase complex protein AlgI
MLFFEIDFLFLFLLPLLVVVLLLKPFWPRVLPWVASGASIVFLYVFSSVSVAIAIFSLLVNYFAAVHLLRNRSIYVFGTTIAVNLIVLAYFKYSILVDRTLFGGDSSWTWRLALPLGISFYTFQQIAFVADVWRGKVTSFSFKTYILFKLFFPQFVAGPITHFGRVVASYERWPTFNVRSIHFGLALFALGMAKKLCGDFFAPIANAGFAHQATLTAYDAWVSMLAFTFQIYFDFAGYSDMAVGLARIFGVSLPFNFNSPYKAKSLSDFWRRWHITLSQWLRDYLYIPLGGNRHGASRMALALFITMALGGLWHGANWTFLLWGIAHGLGLIIVRFFGFPLPAAIRHALLLLFVMGTWVLFRSDTLTGAVQHYAALVNRANPGVGVELQRLINLLVPFVPVDAPINVPKQLTEATAIVLATAVCLWAPNSRRIAIAASVRQSSGAMALRIPLLVVILIVLSIVFISPDTANAFIYFEF